MISLYVDDIIYTGNYEKVCIKFKESMKQEFEMTDLGQMKFFLGIEVNQSEIGIFICQQKYTREILEQFDMESSKAVTNPMVPSNKLTRNDDGRAVDVTLYKQMIGNLMYLTATRPDLMCVVCLASRYMERQ